ncbi:MAG: hypothetical protein ACOY82_06620 [Pseudomonadota bacterium]
MIAANGPRPSRGLTYDLTHDLAHELPNDVPDGPSRGIADAVPTTFRVPPADDPVRWKTHRIGAQTHRVAQPITFTPYAAARPCSARCVFCSENLRPPARGRAAATLRPGPRYFEALDAALAQLRGLPLSYSLSGLETTDDPDWCLRMLQTLDDAARTGVPVADRVLYSNGAGFAHPYGETLLRAFSDFGLSWPELSRHHPDAARNQAIMRFRPEEPVADNAVFETVARRLGRRFPLRMVCIVQRGGVEDPAGVDAYLRWARSLGAECVIFREFSRLDEVDGGNATARRIASARVTIDALLGACASSPLAEALTPVERTEGYYFRNLRLRHRDGFDVVFEASDYARMRARHATGDLYKLVFHANGRLCGGWSPDRDVLWSFEDA